MDKLLNEFTVNRPIDETWTVLTDVERIAPCMPGAALEEIEGDVFRGVVKVKLGAISTAFKGQANFVERDDAAHRAVLKGEGRDTTGKGNASALITAKLEPIDADSTKCFVETDLHITGKVAQFGRGIMGDVSKKLMNQFAANLNKMLDQQPEAKGAPATPVAAAPAEAAEEPEPAADASPSIAPAGEKASTNGATKADAPATSALATGAPAVRKINGPAAAPIELSDVAGSAILKRALPLVGGLVLLWIIVRRFTRR
ncbi:MAG: SRPBCC family protein [Ilumatobacteraceae bacterium]